MFGILYGLVIILFAGKLLFSFKPFSLKGEPAGIRMPLYFLAGSATLSLYMFLLYIFGIRLSVFSVSLPFVIYIVYYILGNHGAFFKKLRSAKNYLFGLSKAVVEKRNLPQAAMIVILLTAFVLVLFQNILLPVYIGDSYAHWFFKAKVIFTTRTISEDLLTNLDFYFTRTDYPLLVPLNIAWLSMCLGRWSDTVTRIFFPLSYFSLASFFYFSLKKYLRWNRALAGAFVVFLIPNMLRQAATGYVDINVSVFMTVSMIALFGWMKDNENNALILISGFFAGAAAWTKNDGLALFAAALLVFAGYLLADLQKRKTDIAFVVSRGALFLAAACPVFLPFRILVAVKGIKNHMIGSLDQILGVLTNFQRAPHVLGQFSYEFFQNTSSWLYFWIFFFLVIVIKRESILKTELKYLCGFLFIAFTILYGVFMVTALGGTTGSLIGNLGELDRLILQVAPTAGFLMFLAAFGEGRQKHKLN